MMRFDFEHDKIFVQRIKNPSRDFISLIDLPAGFDYKKEYRDYLEEKYK